MKTGKKIIAVIICLLTLSFMLSIAASAEDYDTYELDGIYYYCYEGTASVIDCDREYDEVYDISSGLIEGTVTIPSSVRFDGRRYTVDCIDSYALSECPDLKKVVLPETITSIYAAAFYGCNRLEEVVIPDNCEFEYVAPDAFSSTDFEIALAEQDVVVFGKNYLYMYNSWDTEYTISKDITTISDYCFAYSFIESITIPETVELIGSYAFAGCMGLEEITIPGGLEAIPEGAFKDCMNLKKVVIEEGITEIFNGAFENIGAKTVNIPASVSYCDGAFMNCANLESYTVSSGNETYYAKDGILFEKFEDYDFDITYTSLVAYPPAKSGSKYVIPADVNYIADYAFSQCRKLNEVDLGNSCVSSIGSYAFAYDNITSFDFSKLDEEYCDIYDSAFRGCQNLTSVNVNVDYIGDYAFAECSSLKDVETGDRVSSIGCGAFSDTPIESIVLTGSDLGVNDGAFRGCTELKSVEFGEGVTYLGVELFLGCPKLERVYISKTVEYIEDTTFNECENVKFETIKRSEGYKFIKNNGFDFEVVGKIPFFEYIFSQIAKIFRRIFFPVLPI